MIQELLDILNTVGQVADTPGAFVRSSLAGRNPFESVFDTDKRISGRDLLEQYGILDANQEGFDLGDVAGFATEFATDPLNLIGAGLAGRAGMANKAIRAGNEANLLRHGEESALTGLHNLGVDSAYRKLDDMLSDVKQSVVPDKIINADLIPEGVTKAWRGEYPEISDAELWAIAKGAPHEVSDTILGRSGTTRQAAHPVAQQLGDRAGVSAFGYPKGELTVRGEQAAGFVPHHRPDVMFVGDQSLPSSINTSVHELLHTMVRRDPKALDSFMRDAGDLARNDVNIERFGEDGLGAFLEQFTAGTSVNNEEAMAHIVGNSAMRGASKQRFPVTDALNVDFQDVIPEYASLIKERYPTVNDPTSMAARILDYIFGQKKQSNALVPAGALNDMSKPKSFADGLRMTDDELAAILSGYKPPPEDPWFTPTQSQKPLAYIMSLLNALTAPERASHQ